MLPSQEFSDSMTDATCTTSSISVYRFCYCQQFVYRLQLLHKLITYYVVTAILIAVNLISLHTCIMI